MHGHRSPSRGYVDHRGARCAGVAWLANRWSARLVGSVCAAGIAVAVTSAGAPLSVTAVDDTAKPLPALMHLMAGVAFFYSTRRR